MIFETIFLGKKELILKKLRKILLIVLATILLLAGTCVALLYNGKVQNFLVGYATKYLSEKLHSKVSVDFVGIDFLNKISLQGVYIEDQQGDTLLYARKLNVRVRPLALLRSRVELTKIELVEPDVRLVRDTNKVFNFQFILDAFKTDDPKSNITWRFKSIVVKNGAFVFDDEGFERKSQGFDAHHFALSKFNTNILIDQLTDTQISVALNELAFKERCGFKLKNLSFSLKSDTAQAKIDNLVLELPHSSVSFQPITVQYGSFDNLKKNPEKVNFNFTIDTSTLHFSDLECFVPAFGRMNTLIITADCKGSVADLHVKNLNLMYDDLAFQGDFSMSGMPDWRETFVFADIKNVQASKTGVQRLISSLQGKPFALPAQLKGLENVHYKGNISGFFSDLVAYGTLQSDLGVISIDMLLKLQPDFSGLDYSGSLKGKDLKPNKLLADNPEFTNISLNISSKGKIRKDGFKGSIDGEISALTYNDYTYETIRLKGDFDRRNFKGQVSMNDPNGQITFNGGVDFSRDLPSGLFALNVRNLNVHKLNLTEKNPDLTIGFNVNMNFSGENIDQTNTTILIDNVLLTNKDKELFLEQIYIQSEIHDTMDVLTVNSDLFEGTVRGDYSLLEFVGSINRMFHNYFPALFKMPPPPAPKKPSYNDFVFYFSKFNINKLTDILDFPLSLSHESTVLGFYDDHSGKFRVEMNLPELTWKSSNFADTRLLCNNPDRTFDLNLSSKMNDKMALNLQTQIANDSVYTDFRWENPDVLAGQFHALSRFKRNEDNDLTAKINIFPSQIKLENSVWNLAASYVETDFKMLKIDDFSLEHEKQFLHINGTASSSMDDELRVNLNGVQLGYIMQLVNLKGVSMDAEMTGTCRVQSAFKDAALNLDLLAKDYKFNGYRWGDVKVNSYWDNEEKKIVATGLLHDGETTIADILVEFFTQRKYLDFRSDVTGLPLEFLRRYTDDFMPNVSGKGYGKFSIVGPANNLDFLGNIFVQDGRFDVNYLKSSFHFSDTIHMLSDEIRFMHIPVYDKENNRALFSGYLKHQAFGKNMQYDFNIDCKNILALNTTEGDNDDFYGKAYATGRVQISNLTGNTVFDITARTEPKTHITIPIGKAGAVTQNSFIRFVSAADTVRGGNVSGRANFTPSQTNVGESTTRMQLQIEATPDAEIVLITDPIGGDRLKATGIGNLRVEYDPKNNMKLFGVYEVEQGEYLFTLQQVALRNFKLKQGGTIRWSGDPTGAIIHLDAIYPVPDVSLNNILDETQLQDVSRRSTNVNCLLNLTGNLMQPDIKFDIEVPSNPEVQMRVKNVVSTEEMMNREILALLVMGQFYKPENIQTSSQSALSSAMVSVVTTAVGGQLNSWLSAIAGNKFNIGLNARFGDGENVSAGGEYGVNLSWQPSPRLVVNSTLGYNNDPTMNANTSGSFVGDIDVEYKLNRSGKLRAKAYFHSSDDNYYVATGTSKPTQGVGFIYREDFNTFGEVWRSYFHRNTNKKDTLTKKE